MEYKGTTIKTGRGEASVWLSHTPLSSHAVSGWDGYNFRNKKLAETYIDLALLHAETTVSAVDGVNYLLMSRTAKQVTDKAWEEETGKELPTSFAVQREFRQQQAEERRWKRRRHR